MPMTVRRASLQLAAASFCLLQFVLVEAMAHVRVPDYQHLGRKIDSGNPGATGQGAAKPKPVCDASFGGSDLSVVSLRGTPDSLFNGAELLSLLADDSTSPDIVQVAEGVSVDGTTCPLFVTLSTSRGEQTVWRFAPDDEPAGWFDEWGKRLGGAALDEPKPGSRLSSPFGPRRYYGRLSGGGFHDGIDYESRVGEPIFAAADGVIEHQGWYFEYGLTVKIHHAAQFTTLYAHMSRFANGLGVGSRIRKGELIGYIGMTGRSTGAHLHFSTIVNGKFVDPAPYLAKNGGRSLRVPTLAAFRRWQQRIRAAVESTRDRERHQPADEIDWTTRT